MSFSQELFNLLTSLSQAFDRIGIMQEIKNDSPLDNYPPQELDQLAFLIEKVQLKFEESGYDFSSIEDILDQRLLIRLGNYYFFLGDYYLALEYYKLSNKVEENEWAHYNSALILETQGELEKAFNEYDQAIKLKPEFSQAFRHQAEILILQGKTDVALEKLLQSRNLNPNDPETNKLLANYYIEHGDKKEAIFHLKAIHYRDASVSKKIEELEKRKSFIQRLSGLFQKKN